MARNQTPAKYFDAFFEEKEITPTAWCIEHDGTVHMIDTDYVVSIIKATTGQLADKIARDLRRIDFHNGDVVRYLHHVAKGYVSAYYA